MADYKVVEKFVSINGEGTRAGQLAVFIRLQGCNLECSYCDTAWANTDTAPFTWMSGNEIYDYIQGTGVSNVTLTGGEPLMADRVIELLQLLGQDTSLYVEIETNGSIDLKPFSSQVHRPSFTMDYKLPGSLMEGQMLVSNFDLLKPKDTVKFVASNMADLERAKEVIEIYNLTEKCHVYMSTVFGEIGPSDVVDFMKDNNMNGITFQLQMHKFIWEPELRGV